MFVWLGNAIGGICATFVVYVTAGSLVGRAIALWDGRILNTWGDGQPCWPFHSPVGLRLHLETDSGAGILWLVTAAIPSVIVEFPALVVRRALTDIWPALGFAQTCFIVDDWIVTFAPALFALLSVAGLVYWYDRARLFALLLFVGLIAEIGATAVFG